MAFSKIPKFWLRGGIGLIQKLLDAPSLADVLKQRFFGDPTFTVGAEASDAIDVTVQLKDIFGDNIAEKVGLEWWVSDAAGGAPAATAPAGGTAVQTGTALAEYTAEKYGKALTDATGKLVLRLTNATTTPTFYVNVLLHGRVFSSGAVTFA